jgi:DNA-binding FadR family transcriptional regulator
MPAEISIGEAFGVGRTTVREALRGLVAAGFVERQGNRLVVRDPSSMGQDQLDYGALAARVSVRELYETRKLIEVHTAELAAEHATSKGLHMLERLLIRTEAPHDESFKGADAECHGAHAAESGPGEHRHIFEAIAARDSEAAGHAMFDHLDRLELDLIARLEPEPRVARTTA